MSLILDALNRSRQDSDAVPGLATQHYVDAEDGGGQQQVQADIAMVGTAVQRWW